MDTAHRAPELSDPSRYTHSDTSEQRPSFRGNALGHGAKRLVTTCGGRSSAKHVYLLEPWNRLNKTNGGAIAVPREAAYAFIQPETQLAWRRSGEAVIEDGREFLVSAVDDGGIASIDSSELSILGDERAESRPRGPDCLADMVTRRMQTRFMRRRFSAVQARVSQAIDVARLQRSSASF